MIGRTAKPMCRTRYAWYAGRAATTEVQGDAAERVSVTCAIGTSPFGSRGSGGSCGQNGHQEVVQVAYRPCPGGGRPIRWVRWLTESTGRMVAPGRGEFRPYFPVNS